MTGPITAEDVAWALTAAQGHYVDDERGSSNAHWREALAGKLSARLAARTPDAATVDNFVWKWIERGLFDKDIGPREALSVLAGYPDAPWMTGRWDVDHKPYAAEFYKRFPHARAALSSAISARGK